MRLHEGKGAELKPGEWEELPSYLAHYPGEAGRLSGNPFWITIAAGRITAIDEQYPGSLAATLPLDTRQQSGGRRPEA